MNRGIYWGRIRNAPYLLKGDQIVLGSSGRAFERSNSTQRIGAYYLASDDYSVSQ